MNFFPPPKKYNPDICCLLKSLVLGALQISGLYFGGRLDEPGIQASLAHIWAKSWHFCGFLPNFLPCQLSSSRTSGFSGSRLGKTLTFPQFLTQFPDLLAQFFSEFRLRWLAFGQNSGIFAVFLPNFLTCRLSSSRDSGCIDSRLGKILAFSRFFTQFTSLPAQFFHEFGLRWLAFGQNTGFFAVFYPIQRFLQLLHHFLY